MRTKKGITVTMIIGKDHSDQELSTERDKVICMIPLPQQYCKSQCLKEKSNREKKSICD